MNGLLVIDKPKSWTSHDVVNRVRRLSGERSVGHLGTLDPMATGVLPIVLGKWTRLSQFYLKAEKTYEGSIRFGFSTDTYDAEGEATSVVSQVRPSAEELEKALTKFRGEITQMPPPFSAKKIQGVPAYKLARKKEDVTLQPVNVTVKQLDVISCDGDLCQFVTTVSAGTYVRSLAHDLGAALGCGAHLAGLRRTQSGEFTQAQSATMERLEADGVAAYLLPARAVLPEMPSVIANDQQMQKVRHGNPVNLSELSQEPLVKVFDGNRELVALASRIAGTLFQPKIVLIA
ncbi:MAG TPA: tRNA pseudouridine(55) synthase TruB [Terriglobales bacterium]|nr:tRNA pseudouridine(55) synthase TruB [Terriglobales bacterium]